MSNAFKYTNNNGEISLNVNIKNVEYFKSYNIFLFFKVYVFIIKINLKELIKVNEGEAGKYFYPKKLPENISNYTKKIIEDYLNYKNKS